MNEAKEFEINQIICSTKKFISATTNYILVRHSFALITEAKIDEVRLSWIENEKTPVDNRNLISFVKPRKICEKERQRLITEKSGYFCKVSDGEIFISGIEKGILWNDELQIDICFSR